jgi:hypothetical protein
MVVAFVEVETPQARMFRQAAQGLSVDEVLAEGRRPTPKPYHDHGHTPEGRLRYWCGADGPESDDTFRVAPVYRTSHVEDGAQCEECGLPIRDLQEMLSGF